METIAVCVCTCKRPNMLGACLASLSQQQLPDGLSTFVIVVDNDPAQSAAETVKQHTETSPLLTFLYPGANSRHCQCAQRRPERGEGDRCGLGRVY